MAYAARSSEEDAPSFSAKIVSAEVVEHGDQDNVLNMGLSALGKGRHAEFAIQVMWDGKPSFVKKRFSEFDTFHNGLKERFRDLPFSLPAKTALRVFGGEDLEDRKNALNAYLKELCRQTALICNPYVLTFFGVMGGGARQSPSRKSDGPHKDAGSTIRTQDEAVPSFPREGITSLSATVEHIDVVDQVQDKGDVIGMSLDMLKSRVPLLGQGQHAEYTILVTWDGNTHRVKKRFSEVDAMHQSLKDLFPAGLSFSLPAKSTIRHFSEEALYDRKNALNAYFKEVCRHADVIHSTPVQRFFFSRSHAARLPYVAAASANAASVGGAASSLHNGFQPDVTAGRIASPYPDERVAAKGAQSADKKEMPMQSTASDRSDDLFGWDR